MPMRHVEVGGQPSKRSKKSGVKGSVASFRESFQMVVYLKILMQENLLFYVNQEIWDRNAVKFSNGTWHQIKIRERKGPSRGINPKCAHHERSLCAPKFEERSHETLHQERCARRGALGLGKHAFLTQKY